MPTLKLHIKTALIASAVALALLVASSLLVAADIASQLQDDQRYLAQLHAENLAETISLSPIPLSNDDLRQFSNFVMGARPNLTAVRIWRLQNGDFKEETAADDSLPAVPIPQTARIALLNNRRSQESSPQPTADNNSIFRVFVPITINGQIAGAVEVDERLETVSSIAKRFVGNFVWIALATVLLMIAAFYLLFQSIVYQPVEKILSAMDRAREGDLGSSITDGGKRDEFGRLSSNFNAMMTQIREMTSERERQNEILSERVASATGELTQKNEQLETANVELFQSTRRIAEMERLAAAGQTAAQFAHEVGTPLNLISGHVQLLAAETPEGTKTSERIATISRQIERIETIVREMLDRTRFGSSEHASVDLNQQLRRLFDAVEPTLAQENVILDAQLTPNLPAIAADENRLQQVFLNLAKNALDAMPDGGRLRIATRIEDDRVVAEFADNGSGMDEATRAQIFQPLFTTKERGRGTGLGLVVVRQILLEHDATISVDSKPGDGAKFTISFPAL